MIYLLVVFDRGHIRHRRFLNGRSQFVLRNNHHVAHSRHHGTRGHGAHHRRIQSLFLGAQDRVSIHSLDRNLPLQARASLSQVPVAPDLQVQPAEEKTHSVKLSFTPRLTPASRGFCFDKIITF